MNRLITADIAVAVASAAPLTAKALEHLRGAKTRNGVGRDTVEALLPLLYLGVAASYRPILRLVAVSGGARWPELWGTRKEDDVTELRFEVLAELHFVPSRPGVLAELHVTPHELRLGVVGEVHDGLVYTCRRCDGERQG